MATSSPTRVFLRDELVGFARSKVMLVLWIVLPVIAILAFLALPHELTGDSAGQPRSAAAFVGLIMSSIAGTASALMVAVDIVSERNRKVYELFVIRPIHRSAILWAKFIAVFVCVGVACIVATALGVGVDMVRGDVPTRDVTITILKSLASLIGVLSLSIAVGILFGVLARSIVAAVILVLYIGQNLAIIPMLPVYLGYLPGQFWPVMLVSLALTYVVMLGATTSFRRAEF